MSGAANCPSCGAPVEFRIGSSMVLVCEYCRTLVARTDRGLEAYGKVAALIDTGSPLKVGLTGRYRGKQFRLTGRTQLRHQAGGFWDEWYAAFDDGRWGWLAEAQGKYYVTFKVVAAPPPFAQLELGQSVPELDAVVTETGRAELASAEGEIPWRPVPGEHYDYADLAGEDGRFATIDYSESPPVVFKGTETTLGELGISAEAARRARVAVTKLNCSQCGGPLDLRAPDRTERIYCPNCGSGHDVTAGKLQYFQTKKQQKVEPVIPLGTTGTIDDVQYVIAGFMQRSVTFDQTYYWTEYLLFNQEKGFRWLVNSDNHWSFVTPISTADVTDANRLSVAKSVHYEGKAYRVFQQATARVRYVVGEFYWKVKVDEKVTTVDYIRPPEGISKEITQEGAQELVYSHARYMQPDEVEKAFGVTGLDKPIGVGPIQPYTGPKLAGPWALFTVLLIVVAMVVAARMPNKRLTEQSFELVAAEGSTDNTRVWFVDPFEISGDHNIAVYGFSGVENTWVYATGDLINESTGELLSFDMPIEYYKGVDGGESWSEGSRDRTRYLPTPSKGRYAMRIEAQWEPGKTPPPLQVQVREGVFRLPYFFLAFFVLSILPVMAMLFHGNFEVSRWKDSEFNPYQTSTEEDE